MKPFRIADARRFEGRWLRLWFSDGAIVEVDVGPLLDGPVFEELRAPAETEFLMVQDNPPDTPKHPKRLEDPDKAFVYVGDKRLKKLQKQVWEAGWWPEEKRDGSCGSRLTGASRSWFIGPTATTARSTMRRRVSGDLAWTSDGPTPRSALTRLCTHDRKRMTCL